VRYCAVLTLFFSCTVHLLLLKVAELDRRLKQVCEELNCERHNADASRTLLQNKLHEEEKSKKKELSAAQDSIRSVEKQLEELKAK